MSSHRFGPYTVDLSNQDKILFPDRGITKGDLVEYYLAHANTMLPYLKNRPLALHRFPDGINTNGFVQQRVSDYFPDWLQRATVERAVSQKHDTITHPVCNNKASLAYLANQGTVSFHGWLSRTDRLDKPDHLIFDLDPSGDDFAMVVAAARCVIELFGQLGANPFVMTTGSRGLHILVPLQPKEDFDTVRDVARAIAEQLEKEHPKTLTTEQRKNKRGGRIYLDIMRNAYGQTAVIPYSVRARPKAPIATPLTLDELDDGKLDPQRYTIENIGKRLKQMGDPWKDLNHHAVEVKTLHNALRGQ